MFDIVCRAKLPLQKGIKKQFLVSLLKNFKTASSEKEAKDFSRMKQIFLYVSTYELEEGIYKDLHRGKSALVFSFYDILKEKGFRRAIALSKMRLAFSSCRKNNAGFVACSMAQDKNSTRTARELEAFKTVLGMNQHEKQHADELMEKLVK